MKTSLAFALAVTTAALAHDASPTPFVRRQLAPPAPAPGFVASFVVPLVMNSSFNATPAGLAVASAGTAAASSEVASSTESAASAGATSSSEGQVAAIVNSAEGSSKASSAPPPSPAANGSLDATVLAFAATLEDFEAQLYNSALSFSAQQWQQAGFSSAQIILIQETIQTVLVDEQTHLQVLSGALSAAGAPFQAKCSFDFSSVTDPLTFLSIAAAVEPVGVGAYQGAAPLVSPAVLGPVLQIHPVESRHAAALSLMKGESFAPVAFDMPLAAQEVLAIAGGFFQGCTAADLGLTSNNPLVAVNSRDNGGSFQSGDTLQFTSTVTLGSEDFCQVLIAGQTQAFVMPISQCVLPQDVDGLAWVFVTKDSTPLSVNDSQQRASATNICAGPAQVLIVNQVSNFASFFGGSVNVGHVNGAQVSLNQMQGWRDNGAVNINGHEVTSVVFQTSTEVIIIDESGNNQNGGNRQQYNFGRKGQHQAPSYYGPSHSGRRSRRSLRSSRH